MKVQRLFVLLGMEMLEMCTNMLNHVKYIYNMVNIKLNINIKIYYFKINIFIMEWSMGGR